MTDNNYVYDKGTVFVARGGGSAPEPLPPGTDGQALIYDSTSELGVRPGAGGTGDVTGPGSSTTGHLASFGSTDGDLLADSGIVAANVALGVASTTSGNVPTYSGTGGKQLGDSGLAAANLVTNAGASTDNALARFDSTTGKILQNSPVTMADTTGTMTFPAAGGIVMSSTANAGVRKGAFTFDGSGTHAKILTTSALADSVICTTVVTVSGASEAQAIACVIDPGVGFTPTSADSSDASVVNWAIVA